MPHTNSGWCLKCRQIVQRYPGLNEFLWNWFEQLQVDHPDVHLSCAGRGKLDQEAAFVNGTSKAHFGQSSHNWNCAIDLFQLTDTGKAAWNKEWFNSVVAPSLLFNLNWYGRPGSSFYELPHVELLNWRFLRDSGRIRLVE